MIEALACLEIRKEIRQVAPHALAVSIHHGQIGSDVRREIDLVDHQKIGSGNSRTAFAWDLIASRHINNIDHLVRKFRTECRSQIVAAALDKHQFDIGMALEQIVQSFLIVRGIFTDCRMRTAAGFDAQNAVLRECAPAREKLGIFLGKDVVRHHRQTHPIAQTETERFHQRSLSRPHRPTDTNHRNMTRPRRRHTAVA